MPRFAANLSMVFTEVPFLDRFDAAREAGFTGVEYLFPYDFEPEAIAVKLRETGLENVLFNMPPGQLGCRRARHCEPSGTRRRVSLRSRKSVEVRPRTGSSAFTRDGRHSARRSRSCNMPRDPDRQPALRRGTTRLPQHCPSFGSHQHARYAGVLRVHSGRVLHDLRGGESAKSQDARWTAITCRSWRAILQPNCDAT